MLLRNRCKEQPCQCKASMQDSPSSGKMHSCQSALSWVPVTNCNPIASTLPVRTPQLCMPTPRVTCCAAEDEQPAVAALLQLHQLNGKRQSRLSAPSQSVSMHASACCRSAESTAAQVQPFSSIEGVRMINYKCTLGSIHCLPALAYLSDQQSVSLLQSSVLW